jgi:hypothetical protein
MCLGLLQWRFRDGPSEFCKCAWDCCSGGLVMGLLIAVNLLGAVAAVVLSFSLQPALY